jgi:small nuclear ribonucleoprotein (snRNP)-like protein
MARCELEKRRGGGGRVGNHLNYRLRGLRVAITDGRTLLGKLLAYLKLMNLGLSDCNEVCFPENQPQTRVLLFETIAWPS